MNLGARVKAAQATRGLGLMDTVVALRELGEEVPVSTLGRMLDGSRPGDPRVWGKLWELFALPLDQLYSGLGLPIPLGEPSGLDAEIYTTVNQMDDPMKHLVLSYARNLPGQLAAAGLRHLPLVSVTAPADNPSTATQEEETGGTARERFERHRASPAGPDYR